MMNSCHSRMSGRSVGAHIQPFGPAGMNEISEIFSQSRGFSRAVTDNFKTLCYIN